MAKWNVAYSDPETGDDASITVEAPSWGAAKQAASKQGVTQPRSITKADADAEVTAVEEQADDQGDADETGDPGEADTGEDTNVEAQ